MFIIDTTETAVEFEFDEVNLDALTNEYKRLLNAAYKRIQPKVPAATSKKTRKAIRKAIEVGIGIANEMYDFSGEYVGLDNYNDRLNDEVEEIGGPKATATEKCLIKQAIEAGIRASIKDIMVREGRYY